MCLASSGISPSPREGRGGGSPSLSWRCASSPRPSPPAGEEREKSQRRNAKHIRGILPPGPEARNGSDFSNHTPIPPGRTRPP
jgi:hypothetical protein